MTKQQIRWTTVREVRNSHWLLAQTDGEPPEDATILDLAQAVAGLNAEQLVEFKAAYRTLPEAPRIPVAAAVADENAAMVEHFKEKAVDDEREKTSLRKMAEELWSLLDDIDTLGDSMRPERTPYFEAVQKIHFKRWRLGTSDGQKVFLKSEPDGPLGSTSAPPTDPADPCRHCQEPLVWHNKAQQDRCRFRNTCYESQEAPATQAEHALKHAQSIDPGAFLTASRTHIGIDVSMFLKMLDRLGEADAVIQRCWDALNWCSGSDDFQTGGRAHVGWETKVRPLFNVIRRFRKQPTLP